MTPWDGSQRRQAARIQITLDLVLLRDKGRGITARTIDLGAGGMRITTDRPLAVDEVLAFDLPLRGRHAAGRARVLRMQGLNVYALRFEQLDEQDRLLLTATVADTA